MSNKNSRRNSIRRRIRGKVLGTATRPRLAVYRSSAHIYAQLIDDENGITLCGVSSTASSISSAKATKFETATAVGKAIAEKSKAAGYESVVFDRGGFLYHGRVKAIADAARDGGLKF